MPLLHTKGRLLQRIQVVTFTAARRRAAIRKRKEKSQSSRNLPKSKKEGLRRRGRLTLMRGETDRGRHKKSDSNGNKKKDATKPDACLMTKIRFRQRGRARSPRSKKKKKEKKKKKKKKGERMKWSQEGVSSINCARAPRIIYWGKG